MFIVTSFIFALISICLLVYYVLKLYLSWNFQYWHKRNVSGPKPEILKGTFPKTSAGECNLVEELHAIYLHYKTTQKYVGVFEARDPKLFILDPQLATQILTKNFKSFRDNESSKWTTPSIEHLRPCSPFVSTGDAWKERRSELVPALTANRLRAFHSIMQQSADKLVKFIGIQNGDGTLDAKALANRFTADFMANFIWGIEADAFSNSTQTSTIHQMANAMIEQGQSCVHYFSRTAAWPWLRKIKPVRFFPAISDRFFKQITTDALHMREQNSLEHCDVINHLLQLKDKKSLSDIQIAGHTTTVLIDGFETGAVLIAHCLLLLSRYKRVQDKLRKELMEAVEEVTYDVLNELPYLDQCLQETLRIFPPLTTLFKLCTETISLNNAELTLQPNDVVYISSYSFHRDADYYENPEEYWPERFDAEFGGVRKYQDMGVFLPFGDGPRKCPGVKLGLAEAKVAIAAVVKQFRIKRSTQTRDDNKIAADSFSLTLDGGIELVFEKI